MQDDAHKADQLTFAQPQRRLRTVTQGEQHDIDPALRG
jgi:hypothetical protein